MDPKTEALIVGRAELEDHGALDRSLRFSFRLTGGAFLMLVLALGSANRIMAVVGALVGGIMGVVGLSRLFADWRRSRRRRALERVIQHLEEEGLDDDD